MIEARQIRKVYRLSEEASTVALDGVSFDIEEGEFVAIMGPSGCGKSTLMHIMGFLDRPSSGSYKFKGRSINELSDNELARIRNEQMGFVFQMFNLLPRTSIYDNVRLPLAYSRFSKKEKDRRIREAIDSVGLTERINHMPNQLSGGEQQRVAIARAIVCDPMIVFADEPTGNLDSSSGQQVMEILQEMNRKGRSIVLVTHDEDIANMAKRIIRLKDGRLVADVAVKN